MPEARVGPQSRAGAGVEQVHPTDGLPAEPQGRACRGRKVPRPAKWVMFGNRHGLDSRICPAVLARVNLRAEPGSASAGDGLGPALNLQFREDR